MEAKFKILYTLDAEALTALAADSGHRNLDVLAAYLAGEPLRNAAGQDFMPLVAQAELIVPHE